MDRAAVPSGEGLRPPTHAPPPGEHAGFHTVAEYHRRNRLQASRCLVAVMVFAVFGCSDAGTSPEENPDAQPTPDNPLDGFVTVEPGIRIHYLDFGGEGDPILLLAGKGNTANVFRDLAPLLTNHYRVRALTRRGFGRSSQPATGYDRATLAGDIVAVLDSLDIRAVHLVGHSIAGEEMSRFGVDHPGRLGRMVYLDAAYDRTVPMDSVPAAWTVPPGPSATDLASRTAFRTYLARVIGVGFPPEEVEATTVVAADGTVLGWVTPSSIDQAISALVEEPDYSAIVAPALAVYAIPDTPDDLAPWLSPGSADWDSALAWIDSVSVPAIRAQKARFEGSMAEGKAIELQGAHHYVFLDQPNRIAGEVLAFLSGG